MQLTVLVTNYNYARYLEDSLASILVGLPENAELLIIDDASTDGSLDIIHRFAVQDQRVRFLQNDKNVGVNATANRGLHEAKGELLTTVASDDKILPDFFVKTVKILSQYPNIGLCCSNFTYFYNKDPEKLLSDCLFQTNKAYEIFSPKQLLKLFSNSSFWIPGNTSIYRRKLVLACGGFHESLKHFSDFYVNNKIALEHGIGYIPQSLTAMRIHSGSYSQICQKNTQIQKKAALNLLNLVLQDRSKKKFQQSIVLKHQLKILFFYIIYFPKFWGFLFPFIKKVFKNKARCLVQKLKEKI